MTLRLANELLDACEGRGEAVKRKKILTEWQKQIELFRILDFSYNLRKLCPELHR